MILSTKAPVKSKLTLLFKHRIHSPKKVYGALASASRELGLSDEDLVEIESAKVWPIQQFLDQMPFAGDPAEQVKWGSLYVAASHGPNADSHTILNVWGNETLNDVANRWIGTFSEWDGFLQAYLVNARFSEIQNTSHPDVLTRIYRVPLDEFVLLHSSYPPPHGSYNVDITKNPGRIITRLLPEWYAEVVAEQMWFAKGFWPCIGRVLGSLSLDKSLGSMEISPSDTTRIVANGGPFVDTSRREQMDALRIAIYGDSVLKFERRAWGYGG